MGKKVVVYIFVLTLFGCFVSNSISYINLAYLYRPGPLSITPNYVLQQLPDSSFKIFFNFPKSKLLYAQNNSTEGSFLARFKIEYKVLTNYESSVSIDTAYYNYTDSAESKPGELFQGAFNIKPIKANAKLLELVFTDLNRRQSTSTYFEIDLAKGDNKYCFFVFNQDTTQPLTRNYLFPGEQVYIQHPGTKKIFVRYYENNFPPASPPFQQLSMNIFDFKDDSIFSILRSDSSSFFTLNMEKEGIYYFQTDTNNKEGLALFRFHNGFPNISMVEQMMFPLQYITSKKEYEFLSLSKDRKNAIDNFWLECADNPERAKVMIKKFYTRVALCNELFTSYLEGWKTDRGLIYLIYGPPSAVYRTTASESWVYGEEQNMSSINFIFSKVDNPFSDNDYELNRSTIYQTSWYNMVDGWRRGRIYSNN